MRKRLATIILLAFTATSLVACGNSTNVNITENATDTSAATEVTNAEQMATAELTAPTEPADTPHEHAYIEAITAEATCTTDGEANYTCECGDTYTEVIPATGHIFENYTSNNDATYLADGTETATCVCGETDTRTAEGSMLTYTYTDLEATMYAQRTVNVRSMPGTDGEKLGGLSTNDEVKVTGQCVETSWYRIEYNGNVAYVSDSYLGNDKVEVQTETPAQSSSSGAYSIVLKKGYSYVNTTVSSYDEAVAAFTAAGIEPWVVHEENGVRWCYAIICHAPNSNNGNHSADFDAHVGGHYYWGNLLGTKDGRVYVEDVNGGSWSIRDCYGDIFQVIKP